MKGEKGDLAQRMERSPLSDMEDMPAKAARPEFAPRKLFQEGPGEGDIAGAIKELISQVRNLSVNAGTKEDINNLQSRIMVEAKHIVQKAVSEAVDPMKDEIYEMRRRLTDVESAQSTPRAASVSSTAIEAKLAELEQRYQSAHQEINQGTAAVFGGLDKFESMEAAKEWLSSKLKELGAKPYDIYTNGDFSGILFAKFATPAQRDEVASRFGMKRFERGGKLTWAREDLPIERRVPENYLFIQHEETAEGVGGTPQRRLTSTRT